MALKILQIRNRLDLSRKAMDELVGKDAEFEQRYADLEAKIPEARDLEARAAIDGEIAAYDEELTAHNEAKENLRREIEELEAELAELDRPVEEEHIEKIPEERKENHPMEVRNTPEYIDAYAEYIKTGDDSQVRSLLTEQSNTSPAGTVAVPSLVYDIVKTAWEKEGIMRLVRKAYLRGNLKVGFEASAGDAAIHTTEGTQVSEESLVLGTVTLTPKSIKKWINYAA